MRNATFAKTNEKRPTVCPALTTNLIFNGTFVQIHRKVACVFLNAYIRPSGADEAAPLTAEESYIHILIQHSLIQTGPYHV